MQSFEALRVLRLRLQGVGLPNGVAQAELRATSPTWGVKSGGVNLGGSMGFQNSMAD